MSIETLERRRLFSVSLDAAGNLVQTGTDAADTVTVGIVYTLSGPRVSVVENGVTTWFNRSSVSRIYLRGLGGNDVLQASSAINVPVTLYGMDGDDTLVGGSANDTVSGGAGNDTLDGGLGQDNLHGSTGHDIVTYAARTNSVRVWLDGIRNDGEVGELDSIPNDIEEVRGGQGRDYLYGNDFANRLDGGAGNDYIRGYLGDDILLGGAGSDIVYADAGMDYINGDAGNDYLYGDGGADRMWGGSGNDEMFGGDGDDRMNGAGFDYEFGPPHRSYAGYLSTDPATDDDFVAGQAGRDGLMDFDGSNSLYGGAGNDWFLTDYLRYTGPGGSSYIDGGEGYDIASYFDFDVRVNVEANSRSFDEDLFYA